MHSQSDDDGAVLSPCMQFVNEKQEYFKSDNTYKLLKFNEM